MLGAIILDRNVIYNENKKKNRKNEDRIVTVVRKQPYSRQDESLKTSKMVVYRYITL